MFLIIRAKPVTGTYNAAGDPASGPDTVCDSILCSENYRVSDHECVVCAPGTYRFQERCKWTRYSLRYIILCSENEYISNHTCQACPVGTYNAAGDPAKWSRHGM